MIVGIDLGTKNLAVYSKYNQIMYSEADYKTFENMVDTICNRFSYYDFVFVDFIWNEIYLPGKRLPQAKKYYIAGALSQATNTYFISPAKIRDMLGIPAKIPKREVHKTAAALYPEMKDLNVHMKDAFLLAKWGEKYV